jgi:hypothetical protein
MSEPERSFRLAAAVESSPSRDTRRGPASSSYPPAHLARELTTMNNHLPSTSAQYPQSSYSSPRPTPLNEGIPSPSRTLSVTSPMAAASPTASPVQREELSQYFEIVAQQTAEELTRRQRAQGKQTTEDEAMQLQHAWSKVLEQSESVTVKLQEEQNNLARYEAMTEQLRQVTQAADLRGAELQQELKLSEDKRKAAEDREKAEREAIHTAERRAEETARMLAEVEAKLQAVVGGAPISSSPQTARPESVQDVAPTAAPALTRLTLEPEPEPEQRAQVPQLALHPMEETEAPRSVPQTPREQAEQLALEVKQLEVVQFAAKEIGGVNSSPRAADGMDGVHQWSGDVQATEMLTQATTILQTREMKEKNKRHDTVKAFYEKQQ